jgi:hypothetical protein
MKNVPALDYRIDECDVQASNGEVVHLPAGFYQVAEFDEVAIFDGLHEVRMKKVEFERLKLNQLAKLAG